MPAPIILFVFNRPDHTRRTLQALAANPEASESELSIFADGPRKDRPNELAMVQEVRRVIRESYPFKKISIQESEQNRGLANSVIRGVTEVLQKHDSVIVLEDDVITAPSFLQFMNTALSHYSKDPQIFSVSGYSVPVEAPAGYSYDAYLGYRFSSWGWATWKDRWGTVDWEVKDYPQFQTDRIARSQFNLGGDDLSEMLDRQRQGKVDSWAVRMAYGQFKKRGYTVFSLPTLVVNEGFDGSGTHCQPGAADPLPQGFHGFTASGPRLPQSHEIDSRLTRQAAKHYAFSFKKKVRLWVEDRLGLSLS
jgi:hypothetical protein